METNLPPEAEMHNEETFEKKCENLIHNGYNMDVGKYIQMGYDIFKKDIGNFVAFTLILGIITTIISFIPLLGWLLSGLVSTPLAVGYAIVGKKILNNEKYEFQDFFRGFDYLGNIFVTFLVSSIIIAIGFVLLIIPGIYLAVSYIWIYYFVVFKKQEFWPAMEYSRKVITKNWFSFFALLIILFFINVLGAIMLGIGLLFTIPISVLTVYAAFDDIIGS